MKPKLHLFCGPRCESLVREEKREWGAAGTENQPGWIRLNIDKHAVAITAALGTREKMNSVCAQSFLCALEDKPLDEEKEYYKSQTKGHWSQGYVPRKKHSETSARELKITVSRE